MKTSLRAGDAPGQITPASRERPFATRFAKAMPRRQDVPGQYSEQDDLHIKTSGGRAIPLVLSEDEPPETKTITEVVRERED